ncbi:MAG: hypothetical protein J0L87_06065 [Bacteroidetes bacterium]|nr:hypothetical protein [Bacteroidota bacterium]
MIKAGSLFYALVISLLITIISSSLILYFYLTTIELKNIEMSQRLQLNVDSGLNLLLSNQSIISANEGRVIDLYGMGNDSVYLKRKYWGAYEILISSADFKKMNEHKIAFAGYVSDPAKDYCIYLKDEDKPLSVCGKTIIRGVAYLPKVGVKRTQIEGQSFSGKVLVDGKVEKSDRNLPKINSDLIEYLNRYLTGNFSDNSDRLINIGAGLSGDSISNSFLDKTILFHSNQSITVSNGLYSGNLIIYSNKPISISSSAILENCLVVSPKIIFEKNFNGTVQAFASDSIILKENVKLGYPSCIGLIQRQNAKASGILIMENDTIIGSVFAVKNSAVFLQPLGISVSEKSTVCGTLFSAGYTDLKGAVWGSLVTDRIILNTSSSVYENHLLNAEIDITKRSKYFVGINLIVEPKKKGVIKWIEN